jgi:hypothetical protein
MMQRAAVMVESRASAMHEAGDVIAVRPSPHDLLMLAELEATPSPGERLRRAPGQQPR